MGVRLLRVSSGILAALAVTALVGGVAAAKPSTPSVPLGNDISWPQCSKKLPSGQSFGIVGVNNGLANTTNPCFVTELSWANTSSGGTGQPRVALYVNTANPGHQGTWWPTSNTYGGATVANPYGNCTGNIDTACAYMYGYAKAYDDATIRGVPNPSSYLWWLDVETINTWQADMNTNRADLEGMTAYFEGIGATVGLYSTNYQWSQIAGSVPVASPLNTLKSWLAGASSQTSAKSMCTASVPLTDGGSVTLAQFIYRTLDYDYSCV